MLFIVRAFIMHSIRWFLLRAFLSHLDCLITLCDVEDPIKYMDLF
jgi:hypothetical protein